MTGAANADGRSPISASRVLVVGAQPLAVFEQVLERIVSEDTPA